MAGIVWEKENRARNGMAFNCSRTSEAIANVADNLLWRQLVAEQSGGYERITECPLFVGRTKAVIK